MLVAAGYLENDVLATASSTERWPLRSIQWPSSQPVPVAMRTARASFQRYKAAVRLCHVRLHDPLSVITTPTCVDWCGEQSHLQVSVTVHVAATGRR